MSQIPNPFGGSSPYSRGYESGENAAVLSRFFNMVYAWMAAGLALTAVVAWYVSTQPDLVRMFNSRLGLGVLFVAEIVLVLAISTAVHRISATVATVLFLAYAALNGMALSIIFLVVTHATLASAFVVTAGTFGAMSLYGMVTRRDLTGLGSYLFMGLIGLVLASVVNMFLNASMLTMIINYVGVLLFVGLTAYDTQRLKQVAIHTAGNAEMAARFAINGALMLYLDFLNLFIMLVSILSDRRR